MTPTQPTDCGFAPRLLPKRAAALDTATHRRTSASVCGELAPAATQRIAAWHFFRTQKELPSLFCPPLFCPTVNQIAER